MTKCTFSAKVWKYRGPSAWYFVTLPKSLSRRIRAHHGMSEEGWGRLKTTAAIGKSKWKTAIWFDTKAKSYLLPIKSSIRKKEKIEAGTKIEARLQFEIDKGIRLFRQSERHDGKSPSIRFARP